MHFIERGDKINIKKPVELVIIIDTAVEEDKSLLIMSDMNSNRLKFDDTDYQYKVLRDIMINCLGKNGVKAADVCPTSYTRTHAISNELDHIYFSTTLINAVKYSFHNSSATDHSPILVSLDLVKKNAPKYAQYEIVRNMKN